MQLQIGWLIWSSLKPIIKLALLLSIGAYCARIKLITPLVSKTLTKFILLFPYPALYFTSIVTSIQANSISRMGILMLMSIVFLSIGHLVGIILARILKPKRSFFNTLIMSCSMGNLGDLPLAIVISVGNSEPFRSGDAAIGVAYISAFLLIPNFYFFIIGLASIGKDMQVLANDEKEQQQVPLEMVVASSGREAAPTPAIVQVVHQRTHSAEALGGEEQVDLRSSAKSLLSSNKRNSTSNEMNWREYRDKIYIYLAKPSVRLWFECLFSPTNIAIILGLIVTLTPQLKALFYSSTRTGSIQDDPPLSFLFECCQTLSQCAIVLSIVNLGSALGSLEIKQFIGWRIAGSVAFTRLCIIPLLCIGFVLFINWTTTWMPSSDPMLRFVIMLEAVVPTASYTVYFTQYWHPRGEAQEISGIVLVQYLICGFTLTLSLIAILSLL